MIVPDEFLMTYKYTALNRYDEYKQEILNERNIKKHRETCAKNQKET